MQTRPGLWTELVEITAKSSSRLLFGLESEDKLDSSRPERKSLSCDALVRQTPWTVTRHTSPGPEPLFPEQHNMWCEHHSPSSILAPCHNRNSSILYLRGEGQSSSSSSHWDGGHRRDARPGMDCCIRAAWVLYIHLSRYKDIYIDAHTSSMNTTLVDSCIKEEARQPRCINLRLKP